MSLPCLLWRSFSLVQLLSCSGAVLVRCAAYIFSHWDVLELELRAKLGEEDGEQHDAQAKEGKSQDLCAIASDLASSDGAGRHAPAFASSSASRRSCLNLPHSSSAPSIQVNPFSTPYNRTHTPAHPHRRPPHPHHPPRRCQRRRLASGPPRPSPVFPSPRTPLGSPRGVNAPPAPSVRLFLLETGTPTQEQPHTTLDRTQALAFPPSGRLKPGSDSPIIHSHPAPARPRRRRRRRRARRSLNFSSSLSTIMAQYVPGSSVTVPGSAAHHTPDDADAQTRLPSICVDYLSHDWEEEDVWTSWRSMTRHKNEIANGVRLENASWRTWWKQRNKLKTISPETLNWLKDSDVTWLYGPLHTAVDPVPPPKASTLEDRMDLDKGSGARKPILKHRTISEILAIPDTASPVLEGGDPSTTSTGSPKIAPQRPGVPGSQSESSIPASEIARGGQRLSPPRLPSAANLISPGGSSSTLDGTGTPPTGMGRRHISFNNFVEQRIALDEPEKIGGSDSEGSIEGSDSEDEGLTMRSTSSVSSAGSGPGGMQYLSHRPDLRRNFSSSSGSETSAKNYPAPDHITIARIAPTTLKTAELWEDGASPVVYAPYGPGHTYVPVPAHVAQSGRPDFPSPAHGYHPSAWEDDDDYSPGGFDYFSGPDLGVGVEYDDATAPGSGGPRSSQPTSTIMLGAPPTGRAAASPSSSPQQRTRPLGAAAVQSQADHQSSTSSPLPSPGPAEQPTSPGPATARRSILKNRGAQSPASHPTPSSGDYFPPQPTSSPRLPHAHASHEAATPSSSVGPTAIASSPRTGEPPLIHSQPLAAGEERGRSSVRTASSALYDRAGGPRSVSASSSSTSPATRATESPAGGQPARLKGGLRGGGNAGANGSAAPAAADAEDAAGRGIGGARTGARPPSINIPLPGQGEEPVESVGSARSPDQPPWASAGAPPSAADADEAYWSGGDSPAIPKKSLESAPAESEAEAAPTTPPPAATEEAEAEAYHSTNPTPVNSPIAFKLRPLNPEGDAPEREPAAPGAAQYAAEEDESETVIGRAAEIVSTARDLMNALWSVGMGGGAERSTGPAPAAAAAAAAAEKE